MFLECGCQFFVEADRPGQCIEEGFGVSVIQAHDFVFMNGFFCMCQCTGQDEIADSLAFKACSALQRLLGTVFQPKIDAILFGICSCAHGEDPSSTWAM